MGAGGDKPPPVVVNYIDDRTRNSVCHMDQFRWGLSREKLSHFYAYRKSVLASHLSDFETGAIVAKFQRRITALEWHPKLPYLLMGACKGGGIACGSGRRGSTGEINFDMHQVQEGTGPGGAIFAIKYNLEELDWLYTASLDGKVNRISIRNPNRYKENVLTLYDTENYNNWFTAMDVSNQNKVLLACTTKGFAHIHHLDGDTSSIIKLHKGKIHHCEFNKSIPYLIATASLDSTAEVCLWDLRNLKSQEALHTFNHKKGANVATFNPTDGSRLLTNDQKDEIRVYQAPLWQETIRIQHPHRQFQHLTPIQAAWYPLHDIIVIGRYPKEGAEESTVRKKMVPLRPIEFFDAKTGENIHRLQHPVNGIISINQFNPTGEVLASSMGCNLCLWQASPRLEILEGGHVKKDKDPMRLPKSTQDALRGRGRKTEETSDDDDDDDFDDPKKPPKKRKTSHAGSSGSKSIPGTSKKCTTLKLGSKSAKSSSRPTPSNEAKLKSNVNAQKEENTKSKSSATCSTFKPAARTKTLAHPEASPGTSRTQNTDLENPSTPKTALVSNNKPKCETENAPTRSTRSKNTKRVKSPSPSPPVKAKRGRGKGHK